MRRITLYIGWVSLIVLLLSACVNERMEPTQNLKEGQVLLYLTTPTHSQLDVSNENYYPETRGAHTGEEAKVIEDKVETVTLLLFDEGGAVLKEVLPMSDKGDLHYQATVTKVNKGYVRIIANVAVDNSWLGKTWVELQAKTFDMSQTATAYPMLADLGVKDFSKETVWGSSSDRIPLLRSFARLSVALAPSNEMEFLGFRTFGIRTKGYLFSQTPLASATTDKSDEAVASYDNRKIAVFLPESTNDDTNQTYIIIKAKYKGVEGFYRIDLRDKEANFMSIERNKHYVVKVNEVLGYGYKNEEEAKTDPYNDTGKKIVIEEMLVYDYAFNSNGNYITFTNSTAIVYGKESYHENGFSGNKTFYRYLLSVLMTDDASISPNDIEILDNSGLLITLESGSDGEKNFISFYATFEGKAKGNYPIRIRYKNIVKTLHVYWMNEYLDCTYLHARLDVPTNHGSEPLKGTFVRIGDDPHQEPEEAEWCGLSLTKENASENGELIYELSPDRVPVYVQLRENINYDNSDFEGFRFSNILATGINAKGRVRYIIGQAAADLSGYFGSTELARYTPYNTDDGTKYDSYLVAERLTDEMYDPAIPLSDYCKSKNPKDNPNLWYLPTSRQLMGLWLTNNSNSRQTSPMTVAPAVGPTFKYLSRSNYTEAKITYHDVTAKSFPERSKNTDATSLTDSKYYPVMSFSNSETSRGPNAQVAIRCVRNHTKSAVPPVSGRQVTMDPENKLTEDYFKDVNDENHIAKKIEVVEPHGKTDKALVYTYTPGTPNMPNTGWSRYEYKSSNSAGGGKYNHYYNWVVKEGWQVNGVDVYRKEKESDTYIKQTNSGSSPGAFMYFENNYPDHLIDKEYTLTEAYNNAGGVTEGRLPTMRELQLIYIYHQLLVDAGMTPFYKEEKDGYRDGTTDLDKILDPDKLLWKMFHYPETEYPPYLHWYWSSSTRLGPSNGMDESTVPLRINFHFGDVNARVANETNAKDHYRNVKTIVEK